MRFAFELAAESNVSCGLIPKSLHLCCETLRNQSYIDLPARNQQHCSCLDARSAKIRARRVSATTEVICSALYPSDTGGHLWQIEQSTKVTAIHKAGARENQAGG